jgi:hypothetical protein
MLKHTGHPSGGFFKLARRAPYKRQGDDTKLWIREITQLARHFAGR